MHNSFSTASAAVTLMNFYTSANSLVFNCWKICWNYTHIKLMDFLLREQAAKLGAVCVYVYAFMPVLTVYVTLFHHNLIKFNY